jgi:hypothetical protein
LNYYFFDMIHKKHLQAVSHTDTMQLYYPQK